MKIGALSLFTRTSDPRLFDIAAWHWRRSLTWSWVLSAQTCSRWRMPRIYLYHRSAIIIIGPIALHFQRQKPMWRNEAALEGK